MSPGHISSFFTVCDDFSLLSSDIFCCQLIAFANSLNSDQ